MNEAFYENVCGRLAISNQIPICTKHFGKVRGNCDADIGARNDLQIASALNDQLACWCVNVNISGIAELLDHTCFACNRNLIMFNIGEAEVLGPDSDNNLR